MTFHLQNADVIMMICVALLATLVIAVRFQPRSLLGLVTEAVCVNVLAVLAVLTFELLPALLA
jgi:hypothetical protein